MNSPCSALDKLIVVPAVKVMKSPQLHPGLFDLHCWHISSTARHQSLFQSKELQLTFDPSPLLPLRKVGALKFRRLTAFQKRVFGGGGVLGHRHLRCRLGVGGAWIGEMNRGRFCVKSLNCAPQHSPKSPFTAPYLKYLQTNESPLPHVCLFAHLLVIRELLFLTQKPTQSHPTALSHTPKLPSPITIGAHIIHIPHFITFEAVCCGALSTVEW